MDIKLSDSQIKQLGLALTINDVLDCIKKDCDSYLTFLNQELKNKEITSEEYKKEINLLNKLKNERN